MDDIYKDYWFEVFRYDGEEQVTVRAHHSLTGFIKIETCPTESEAKQKAVMGIEHILVKPVEKSNG